MSEKENEVEVVYLDVKQYNQKLNDLNAELGRRQQRLAQLEQERDNLIKDSLVLQGQAQMIKDILEHEIRADTYKCVKKEGGK